MKNAGVEIRLIMNGVDSKTYEKLTCFSECVFMLFNCKDIYL